MSWFNLMRAAQAYDLETMREVAVKIHQLNSSWHESKKASYVRHAVREYNIHKSLRHVRIVALLDIFEIDVNTFGHGAGAVPRQGPGQPPEGPPGVCPRFAAHLAAAQLDTDA